MAEDLHSSTRPQVVQVLLDRPGHTEDKMSKEVHVALSRSTEVYTEGFPQHRCCSPLWGCVWCRTHGLHSCRGHMGTQRAKDPGSSPWSIAGRRGEETPPISLPVHGMTLNCILHGPDALSVAPALCRLVF